MANRLHKPRGDGFKQGYYKVVNESKYIGELDKVRFMSSWEESTHRFFDFNTRVVKWSSEPVAIPYVSPLDGKIHKYYPDYYCEYIDIHGEIIKEIVELKPLAQVKNPKANASAYEIATALVNKAKWEAAIAYCNAHGMKFRIITEKSVYV